MPGISGRRFSGPAAVLFFLVACGLFLGPGDWDRRLSTGILDLLPPDEESIESRFLNGYFKNRQADQVVFALHTEGPGGASVGVASLEQSLHASGLFQDDILSHAASVERMAGHLFEHRLPLFFPAWLRSHREQWSEGGQEGAFADWLARRTVETLDAYVDSPEGFYYAEGLGADPLLLLPNLWRSLPDGAAGVPGGWSILTATLRGSAFDEEVQDRVIPALSRLRSDLSAQHPGATLLVTGPVIFARNSRIAIRAEVQRLNLFSLLGVAAVILMALRRPVGLLAIAPMMICGLAGGLVATLLYFGSVHVVMLVLGAFLAGITVDYGFHAFLHPPAESRASLWKPLMTAAGSTAAGFFSLMFGTLPVVRQLGLFVSAGVLSALFAAFCLRPVVPATLTAPRAWLRCALTWKWKPPLSIVVIGILIAAALPGFTRIAWHDDIRELDLSSPELLGEDARIRALYGANPQQATLLTTGPSLLEAIDAWRGLERDWARAEVAPLSGLASALPSTRDLEFARSFMEEDAIEWRARIRILLTQHGFESAAFERFFSDFDRLSASDFSIARTERRLRTLSDALTGATALLMPRGDELVSIASTTRAERTEIDSILIRHPETVSANQLESLNEVFGRYRREGWKLVLSGLFTISVIVLLIYGIRRGAQILGLPVLGVSLTFALLGWVHGDLNLFHLLAGLLGFCLALDHALFAVQARAGGLPPPASVRIAAMTTVVAFGVLATSDIAAVSALGFTVASIVALTAIIIEWLAANRVGEKPR